MNVENTGSPRNKKAIQQKISLFNILTCLLCSSKAKVAHICPNCSKFYCQMCIKSWIKQGNSICPNCKNSISETSIVNCSKLSQDLSNALEALIQLQVQQQTQCEQHNISQTYYCQNCICSLCSDCIVLETKHRGHNVIKLSKVKVQFNQLILAQLSKIRKFCKDVEKARQEKIQMKNAQNQQTRIKIDILNTHIQKVKTNYEQSSTATIQKYEQWLRDHKLIHLSNVKIYEQFDRQIKMMSKVQVVRKSNEKFNEISNVVKIQAENKQITPDQIVKIKESGVCSLVCERFTHKNFVLNNYNQYREKEEVVYSDSFFHGCLEWRLKIYPKGIPKKTGELVLKRTNSASNFHEEYISIYIQLLSGVRQISRCQFSIGIMSQSDESKVISQVYEADFDVGKCWGYDEFASVSTLYQKGYINQEQDSLKIIVSVGPPSYYFSILDKDAIIQNKIEMINRNNIRIQELKNAVKLKNSKVKIDESQVKQNYPLRQQRKLEQQLENVKTPRCKLSQKSQVRGQGLAQSINFKNYVAEPPVEEPVRCSEQFDHQSAELRKIFRRITNMNEKNDLLLF